MMTYEAFFINGKWVPPRGKGIITAINPSTEAVIGRVPAGNRQDVDDAVAAAKAAFDEWSATDATTRKKFITALAGELTARMEEIAVTISKEVGTPIKLARSIQVGLPIATLNVTAEAIDHVFFEEKIGNSLIVKEPIGVCGLISPWNYPLHQMIGKVAPALAAGCTVVIKPSSEAPLNMFLFAEAVEKVGLPPGVLNLVSGSGRDVGEALNSHPGIDMISFTGSTSAGIQVSRSAAPTVKRVTLELGGKSANIILDDADFEKVIPVGVKDSMLNSGQTCSALTRMLVPESRQDEAVQLAQKTAEAFRPGDPLDETKNLGPVVSNKQRTIVRNYIQKGIDEGATLVTGDLEPPEGLDKGYFVKPTIFANVTSEMTIAGEEIFGPVLSIMPYKTDEDAIRIANNSRYGLSGAVSSSDPDRALRVARRMRTGQVAVNGGRFNIKAPFGGYKQSGNGRELGKIGLEEYLEIKSIQL